MERKIIITKNAAETQKSGEDFITLLSPKKHLIALHGELGSGKTTFVQGVAQKLGIKNRVISPTFIIIRTYALKSEWQMLYHLDLYRAHSEQDIKSLGILDLMNNRDNLLFIEWADKMKNLLPPETIHIFFTHLEHDKRKIEIVYE